MGPRDFLCIYIDFRVFILILCVFSVYLYWFVCVYIDFVCICFVVLEISTVSAFCMLCKDYIWFYVSVFVRAPWKTRYRSSGHDYWMLMAVSFRGKGKNTQQGTSQTSQTQQGVVQGNKLLYLTFTYSNAFFEPQWGVLAFCQAWIWPFFKTLLLFSWNEYREALSKSWFLFYISPCPGKLII